MADKQKLDELKWQLPPVPAKVAEKLPIVFLAAFAGIAIILTIANLPALSMIPLAGVVIIGIFILFRDSLARQSDRDAPEA